MSLEFDVYIGIDYSGARSPMCRLKEPQVYAAMTGSDPERLHSSGPSNNMVPWNWTQAEIAQHLIDLAR